ncbi:helix-turn-helix domain-containing protein [Polynucleobacter sp. MWH-UH25E]|uniref:helix-turn-helix domain-containing protein n=1 Tax=Polynucleobacter sp. MWH-UH25E TaxID=1855616 RepID=UPI001BFE9BF9|nr:helix-turn-helix domain-containing protein [Polynucleobacter sp. MWH-UH25E]QWD61933.1 helix-turn-helix domain-containing protein [Polynucleobacter sp. MWH-UH25E]
MNTPNKLPDIKKEAFTKARESLGLSTKELSGMACLSVRQIEQIENGESSSFYGPQVKVTAAKKVAGLLKLKEEDAFDFGVVATNKAESKKETQKEAKDSEKVVKQVQSADAESSKSIKTNAPEKADNVKKLSPSQKAIDQRNQSAASKNPKRKLYILGGVAAALVFSIINLRPLFFPEVVKEEVVVMEQTQAAAPVDVPADPKATPPASTPEPVVAAVAPAPAAVPSTECPADTAAVSYKPDAPKKAGDMVYLQSKTAQTVCVVDASGKTQNKTLEAGVGTSVYGKPPLKVLTSGAAQVDIYYQGVKVRLSNITAKNILLEPAELTQPLAPTDSQFR